MERWNDELTPYDSPARCTLLFLICGKALKKRWRNDEMSFAASFVDETDSDSP